MANQGIYFGNKQILIPGAYGLGDSSGMVAINLSALNALMIIGSSLGGEPLTPLVFNKANEKQALAILRGGDLYQACDAAWNASPSDPTNPGGAPRAADTIIAVRANPATQSSYTFKDTATPTPGDAVEALSADYGAHTVHTQVGILAGAVNTSLRRVVVKKIEDGINLTSPDLGEVIGLAYTGNGTATIQVTQGSGTTTLAAVVTGASDGSASFSIDLSAPAVSTLAKLVAFLGGQAGFAVQLMGYPAMPSVQLDPMTTAATLSTTPVKLLAINGAVADWLTRISGVCTGVFKGNAFPVAVTPPVFLAGGMDGVPTITQYQTALSALELQPGYFLGLCSSDAAIHNAALQHIQQMSDITVKKRRTGWFGHDIGDVIFNADFTVDISALAQRIFAINSSRVVMATPGVKVFDVDGNKVLYPAWLTAIFMAGVKAGGNPQDSVTGQYLEVQDLEGSFNVAAQNALISAGASYVVKDSSGFKVGECQFAQLTSSDPMAVEPSVLHVADVLLTNMEAFFGPRYTGVAPGGNTNLRLGTLKAEAIDALQEAVNLGYLMEGYDSSGNFLPGFRNVKTGFSSPSWSIEFEAAIAEPGNYITILAHWQGVSASA